ncbi:MAG TPA: hypothetical protein VG293_01450 [Solirubrobacteraceae bacterium]|jgi:hypothetical protein|nr:hypothetical protein [Solirubrobacteraceae bacterium]
MTGDGPQTGPRHEPERIHERAADPAEAADRPLEPKSADEELLARDEGAPLRDQDTHHRLNTTVGDTDPEADSDPYRAADAQDEADRASGTTGSGQGAER